MADKHDKSSEVEQQIQTLVDDISQQLKHRVSVITTQSHVDSLTPLQISSIPYVIELENKLAQINETNKQLQQDISHLEQNHQQQVNVLTHQITSAENNEHSLALEQQCKILNQQLDEQQEITANLQKTTQAKTATLDVQNQQITQLNSQLNEITAEFELYQAKSEQLQEKLQHNIDNLESQRESHKLSLLEKEQAFEQELTVVKQQNKQQSEQLRVLGKQHQVLSEETTEQQIFISAQKKENQQLHEQIHKGDARSTQLISEIKTLETQLIDSQESAEKMETSFAQCQQKLASQLAKKQQQESEYAKARATIKSLRDENQTLSTKLTQTITDFEQQVTEYRLRFEYAQKELAKKE
ncbi:hypothetical protein Q4489_17890 [Thalassotalea sp. 1_MG-2023]|uniref:hypothetical protein n=1 Tax=Thalassotalea sp. 1_MG-2023 TaxID=3062680 RepID=UPI0026E3C218|nr:hypothetical protein [Thalassotalea sp. 1_MG-2023]MDO6428878.1 hypothetical protein [Thalassotalea sp. 1_MG-2023]